MNLQGIHRSAPWHMFKISFLVLLGVTNYVGRVGAYMVGNNPYRRVETLDTEGKYILEWEVNRATSRITFNVTVATTGFVGFGLSDNGKMTGADIVIGGVLPNGQTYFSDRHAVGNQIPEEDPSQDWELHEAREGNNRTFLSFSRSFDTCDPQDYPITDDKISLIWAYGERDDELEYHYRNRGEFPVLLIHPDYTPHIERHPETNFPTVVHTPYDEDVRLWSIRIPFVMPAEETTYWCTMHQGPRLSRKHHMIGFDVRFNDEISRNHLHHVIISRCRAPEGFDDSMFQRYLDFEGQICYGAGGRSESVQQITGPLPTEYCNDYLHMTAVGNRINFMPPHVGSPIGETENEYYLVQMHYDNPDLRAGINVDVSLDIFYTPQLRANEGELFVVRHESPGMTPSHLVPPSSIDHRSIGVCGPDCTRKILPDEGIRIYSILLHAHNSGVGMRFRHFRGNQELPFISYEDNFSFNYQQMRVLPREAHILPGDQLIVECTADNTWTNGTVVGGFSTRQEMCAAWFFYYNRLPNNMICTSEIISEEAREHFLGIQNMTWSTENLEYMVTSPRRLAGMPVTQVSDMVDWTLARREELQRFQLTHPHSNRCPIEMYARAHTVNELGEPVDLESDEEQVRLVPYPSQAIPYVPPQPCSTAQGNRNNDATNRRGSNNSRRNANNSRANESSRGNTNESSSRNQKANDPSKGQRFSSKWD